MNKTRTYALAAFILLAIALYHLWSVYDAIQTGCMQIGAQVRCSYQNAGNFQSLKDMKLLFGCFWLAGAAVFAVAAVQARKKRA